MRRLVLAFVSAHTLSLAVTSYAQAPAAASRARIQIETLASDRLEGRLTGSSGEQRASEYLSAELKRIGARPLPGRTDFLLPFEFTAGTKDGGTRLTVTDPRRPSPRTFTAQNDIRALSFSDNGDVTAAPVVFAGYGIVVPEAQNFGYDSYATLDVKDKVVVVLRYFPEEASTATKTVLSRYADLRYKAMAARQRGAKALLVVAGPASPNAGETIPMSFDTAIAGSGLPAASISAAAAEALFSTLGDPNKTLAAAQKGLDSANPHVAGFAIPEVSVSLHTEVIREKRTGHNVVGYLPATLRISAEKPWVALGAHYDHLGHGEHGSTLADKAEANAIHHGADDNASGTAGVLGVAEALASQQRARHVLVAFWSGEEIGLIGSAAFVASPPVPLDQFAAYLNFDMIGRMQDNKLTVQATGSSPVWARTIEQANVAAGFDLLVQQDPYQPTDVASFNQAGVPCLNFFTGTHADYHKPSDTADKIAYDDLDRIVAFATSIAARIIRTPEAPQFTKVEQSSQGARAGVRVFTGTIPDYSTEVNGLLLSGVMGGGPAEAAGLQKGDVIVEIAGQTIANIYDYTYALEVLKINEPAKVVYMRDGERKETTLTPGARR
jgi:Zn-dependent M28 family amino/carboxypeptidase